MPLRGKKMIYFTYVLQSQKNSRYYIGHCANLTERLNKHNHGSVQSTKQNRPWKLVYTEEFQTRAEAYRRELAIKRYKGGIQFKAMLAGTLRKK